MLEIGFASAVAASGLSLTADPVRSQDVATAAKDVLGTWQTAFNDGDIETLRSLYGPEPRNSLVPVGDTPRGTDLVLAFDRVAHAMGTSVEISLDQLTLGSSDPIQLQGPATLETMPMGSLSGEASVTMQETDGTLRVTDLVVSIPMEVLLDSWGDPGELPADAKPLTDMEPGETFQGEPGGLYGDYQNVPPLEQQEAAVDALHNIQPRDGAGNPAEDGTVGFVMLGPSNTGRYSGAFIELVREDPDVPEYLWTLNGCEGAFSSDARAWTLGDYPALLLDHRLAELDYELEQPGLAPEQVQVGWYTPHYYHDMSEQIDAVGYAEEIHEYVREMLPKLKDNFPNLEILYLSGFPYLGYAKTGFGEPMAYAMNLAARSLIRAQIEGDPKLNHDPEAGEVNAPLMLWGPYLWANGETPRSDGLTWSPEDYQEVDGAHPSPQGATKVAELLLKFLQQNTFARSWFLDVEPPAVEDLEAPTPVATPTVQTTEGEAPGFGLMGAVGGIGAAIGYHLPRDPHFESEE
ncbi:MAG: hypothetical protein U5K70_05450 [Halodesulfurarchaeum sp.]|nr:hypothetical protein [Halodesulfurarchaeum sp.]